MGSKINFIPMYCSSHGKMVIIHCAESANINSINTTKNSNACDHEIKKECQFCPSLMLVKRKKISDKYCR